MPVLLDDWISVKRLIATTLLLAGSMFIAAPAIANGVDKVAVCHATSSDTNPYTYILVDDDSVKLKGHLMHRNEPNKTWKSEVVWNGVTHYAGEPKPDLIEGYDTFTREFCESTESPSPTPTATETSATPTPTETSATATPTDTTAAPTTPVPTPTVDQPTAAPSQSTSTTPVELAETGGTPPLIWLYVGLVTALCGLAMYFIFREPPYRH